MTSTNVRHAAGAIETVTYSPRDDYSRYGHPEQCAQVALTVLWHPDVSRVGQRALLFPVGAQQVVALNRFEPLFAEQPLAHPSISRRSVCIEGLSDARVQLWWEGTPDKKGAPRLQGKLLFGAVSIATGQLNRGVTLELGDGTALLLHCHNAATTSGAHDLAMVGNHPSLHVLRRQADNIARTRQRIVLIRAETGCGKELLAQALHDLYARKGPAPFVCVNAAAIDHDNVAVTLFGVEKGIYTSVAARAGLFEEAHAGTLFLDEVGLMPPEVQHGLLRVLEDSRVVRQGGTKPRKIDVRVIAATDARLEQSVEEGKFSGPLLERLNQNSLRIPPLRERMDDLGLLLLHFLRMFMEPQVLEQRLRPWREQGDSPWLRASLVATLARYDWPGNIRQLRNRVNALVVRNLHEPRLIMDDGLCALLKEVDADADPLDGDAHRPPDHESGMSSHRVKLSQVDQLDDAQIWAAMEAEDFSVDKAAKRLGIRRGKLYERIKRCGWKKATDILPETLFAVLAECGGNYAEAARRLRVPLKSFVEALNRADRRDAQEGRDGGEGRDDGGE